MVNLCMDGTTSSGKPALVGFLSGDTGSYWADIPKEDRQKVVLQSMAKTFGEEALNFIDYQEQIWSNEKHVGGCPVALAGTGIMRTWPRLRQSVGRIHFASTESAAQWCGYMNGAVESGLRACLEVLQDIKPHLINDTDKRTLDLLQDGKEDISETNRSTTVYLALAFLALIVAYFLYTLH